MESGGIDGLNESISIDLLSCCYGVGEDFSACVFDGTAGGQASGEAGDLDAEWSEERTYIKIGSVAGHVGVGRHYNFSDTAGADPGDELVDGQVGRFDSFERRDVAAEDVIDPFAGTGFFEIYDIFGLLDDTYHSFIAPGIGADLAEVLFGNVVTYSAGFDLVFDVFYGVGEGQGLGGGDF